MTSGTALDRPKKRQKRVVSLEVNGIKWYVETILNWRPNPNSADGRDYLLQWTPSSDGKEWPSEWAPLQNVSCPSLLKQFWRQSLNLKQATLGSLKIGMVVLAPWIENEESTFWHAEILSVERECSIVFLWDEEIHQRCLVKNDPFQPNRGIRCIVPIKKLWIDHYASLPCVNHQRIVCPKQRQWTCHSCGKPNELLLQVCGFCSSSRFVRHVDELESAVQCAYEKLPQTFRVLAVVSEPSLYRDALLAKFNKAPASPPWGSFVCVLSQLRLWFPAMEFSEIQDVLRWCGISAKLLLLPFSVMSTGQQHRVTLAYVLLKCSRVTEHQIICLPEFCASVDTATARSLAVAIARLRCIKKFDSISFVVGTADGGLVRYLGCEGALQLKQAQLLQNNKLCYEYSCHYISNHAAEDGNQNYVSWFLPEVKAHLYCDEKDDKEVAFEVPCFGFGRITSDRGVEVKIVLDAATKYVQHHYPLFSRTWDGWLHYTLPDFQQFALPPNWCLGALLGPSGCGKSVLMKRLMKDQLSLFLPLWHPLSFTLSDVSERPDDRPLCDYFPGRADLYLTAMQVPREKWNLPWSRLSVTESVCACYARAIAETGPGGVLALDEFTSGLPRDLAKRMAQGLRGLLETLNIRVMVASCHNDLRSYLNFDWVVDPSVASLELKQPAIQAESLTATTAWLNHDELFARAEIIVELRQCKASVFQLFKQHHYLEDSLWEPGAKSFLGRVDSQVALFVAARRNARHQNCYYTSRLVVLPPFQGMGLGPRAEDAVAHYYSTSEKQDYSSITSHEYAHNRSQSGLWELVSHAKSVKTGVLCFSHRWLSCKCETQFHLRSCLHRREFQESRFKLFRSVSSPSD